jgi:phage tail sheath protein FI
MPFLHGTETIELDNGPVSVTVVKSGVIALVGTAPRGATNTLTLVNNFTDAAQFGEEVTGYTIPQALSAIFSQGVGTVLVVNVFDSTTHTDTVTEESLTVLNRKTKTAFAPVHGQSFTLTHTTGTPVYVSGTDYTLDAFGNISILASIATVAETAVLKATYKKLDTTGITSGTIIGTNSGGVRTGFKCYLDAYNMFGFKPKILIAPGFSTLNAVAAEMIVNADYYKAFALVDAPTGTSVSVAISGRGPSGTINFNTSSKRSILLEPGNLKAYDKATDSTVNRPYSQFYAGVMAAQDNENGYWHSPSNREIKGVLGSEIPITAAINDKSTEANALNAAGIVTVFNSGASGLRTWGNRSAAFPSSTRPANFIPILRTADIVHESIELAMLPFIDQPITNGIIDSVRQSVQFFINILIGRKALLEGSEINFEPSKNPPSQLAAGQAVWSLVFMAPPPMERMTFESYIDASLLKSIGQPAA